MDLVNSVTQNSNNTNVTMENQADDDGQGGKDNNNSRNNDNNGSNNSIRMAQNDYLDSNDNDNRQIMQHDAEIADLNLTTLNNKSNNLSSSNNINNLNALAEASFNGSQQLQQQQHVVHERNQIPEYLRAIGMDPRKFWPKKYRFTREKSPGKHNPLNISQRNFYETNGYLIIDDCHSPRLLNAIHNQHKESSLVNEFLLDSLLTKNGKLLQHVKCFCDERVMLMTHQLVESFQTSEQAKAVMDNETNQRQHLFRDWIYLPFRPIDKVVCTITAIEPLEHVLLVVPGTHRVGQCSISSTLETISAAYDTSQETSQQSMARELYECAPEKLSSLIQNSKKGFKYVNLKAGQTLFYHPGLVHGFSDDLVNYNKRQLALIAYYAAADCEYVDLRKSNELMSNDITLPISLAHFKDKNPCDYTSWINKPKLLQDNIRSSL